MSDDFFYQQRKDTDENSRLLEGCFTRFFLFGLVGFLVIATVFGIYNLITKNPIPQSIIEIPHTYKENNIQCFQTNDSIEILEGKSLRFCENETDKISKQLYQIAFESFSLTNPNLNNYEKLIECYIQSAQKYYGNDWEHLRRWGESSSFRNEDYVADTQLIKDECIKLFSNFTQ